MNAVYVVKPTSRFRKDYRLMEKRSFDMSMLDGVIAQLAQGITLPASNCDHALSGNFAGHRACHILPDWLLVYRVEQGVLVLSLTRTGTHSDLF